MERIAVMGIGTAVPEYRLDQRDAASRLQEALRGEPEVARWAQRIFLQCGVETRYTCEPNLLAPADDCRYIPGSAQAAFPTTSERMALYRRSSVPLANEAASKALRDASVRPGDVTHLIAVSCTGMFLPGIEAELATALDLREDVRRLPLTFLGCAAGLTALREAMRIVTCEPGAVALVVAVELCSIHVQPSFAKEDLFTAALFGDGASACVVGAPAERRDGTILLRDASAARFAGTEDLMRWTIGDHGFRLALSPRIPTLIAERAPKALARFWGDRPLPELWAVHPGGRAIVDAVQRVFELTDGQAAASRTILREYGNLSSATILFVLEEIRAQRRRENAGAAEGVAIAFGPGVVAELLRFGYEP